MHMTRAALIIAALAYATVCSQPVAAQTKWDLSTVWPESNFHVQNAKRFAEEVKAATKGTVEITVKSGGQLGFKGPEQLRAVRDGLVPMADILLSQQVGDEPFLDVEEIPFLINDDSDRRILHKHVRAVIEKIFEKNGQVVLYMVPWPTLYLHLNVKIDKPDDIKRLKVRVPDKELYTMAGLVGMGPVMIPWGEVVSALSSGAISGVITSAASAVDGKFWEFLKYSYRIGHITPSQAVTVNAAAWNKLPVEQRNTIMGLAKKLEPGFWAVSEKEDVKSVERLKAEGIQVIDFPPAVLADMHEKTKPMLDDFIKRIPSAGPLLKAYFAERNR